MPPSPTPPLSRRAVLAGGTGATVLGLTGCSLNNPFDDEKTPAAEAVRELAPDVAVAVEAVAAIRTVHELLAQVAAARPALAAETAELKEMHQVHLDALTGAVPDRVDTSPSASATAAKLSATRVFVRRTETDLHDRLVALALRAESGPFARLLGAMAAAISQRLAVLG